jgi:radical SAM superfamily enzyme YgiQ (UPF0313 family)
MITKDEYKTIMKAELGSLFAACEGRLTLSPARTGRPIHLVLVNCASGQPFAADRSFELRPPLGLMYLKNRVEQIVPDFKCEIVDMQRDNISPRRLIAAIGHLIRERPDVFIGLNGFSTNRSIVLQLAETISELGGRCILGGKLVTIETSRRFREAVGPNDSIVNDLESHFRGCLVVGEAEESLPVVLKEKEWHSGISKAERGIGWIEKGRSVVPGEVAPISQAHVDIAEQSVMPSYRPKGSRDPYHILSAGRSCDQHCMFCAVQIFPHRVKSIDRIGEQIDLAARSVEAKEIRLEFIDDNFFLNRDRTLQIAARIEKHVRRGQRVSWRALGRISVLSDFSGPFFEKLKKTGLEEVAIGFESASNEILRKMRKKHTFEQAERLIARMNAAGIRVKLFAMIGYPGEREEEIEKTVRFLRAQREMKNVIALFVFSPYPGTEVFYKLLRKGYGFYDLQAYVEAINYRGIAVKAIEGRGLRLSENTPGELVEMFRNFAGAGPDVQQAKA